MPSKKKKYNARFPAGRIKKIMQTDEEVGKVAQAVPVIISRTLELFVESLLTKSMEITQVRNAKTLTPSHMKQCILSENRFDFLKDLVKNIPDASVQEDNENNAIFEANRDEIHETITTSTTTPASQQQVLEDQSASSLILSANFYTEQSTSASRTTPVIQIEPKLTQNSTITLQKLNKSTDDNDEEGMSNLSRVPDCKINKTSSSMNINCKTTSNYIPSLIPITTHNLCSAQSNDDSLCIDEDYDN